MFFTTRKKEECFGCFSCVDNCPVGAVAMTEDAHGYFYPRIDAAICLECKKCQEICPSNILNEKFNITIASMAGYTLDEEDFLKSSSGGAYKVIVKATIERLQDKYLNFFVAGCKFNQDFKVIHDVVKITKENDIDIFSKSKYVQSNPRYVYKKCLDIINNNSNFLIFTGTPCQIAAMEIIAENYDNVLFIDIVCHGAPSQLMFDEYRKTLEDKYASVLDFYEFRTKDVLENGTKYTRSNKYAMKNGTTRRLNRLEDEYLIDFYNESYPPRESCKECIFKNKKRISDITIGDAWGDK